VFTSIDYHDYFKELSEEYENSKIGKKFPDEEDYYWAESELAEKPYFFIEFAERLSRMFLIIWI